MVKFKINDTVKSIIHDYEKFTIIAVLNYNPVIYITKSKKYGIVLLEEVNLKSIDNRPAIFASTRQKNYVSSICEALDLKFDFESSTMNELSDFINQYKKAYNEHINEIKDNSYYLEW